MSLTQNSLVLKAIEKIDLSNSNIVENIEKNSVLGWLLHKPFNFVGSLLERFSVTSVFVKNIDYLILTLLFFLFIAITIAPTSIIGLLVLLTFGLTILKWFLQKNQTHNITLMDFPTLCYLGICIVSVGFSSYFFPSLKGLAKIFVYIASYFVFTNIFKGKVWKIYLVLLFVALTGSLESLYGVFQRIHGVNALATWQDLDTIKAGAKMVRVYGTLLPYNPNLLGGYLLPILPITAGIGFIALIKKYYKTGIIFILASLAVLLCIIFTASRGAYIGLFFMGISFYLISGHIIWHNFSNHKLSKYLKWAWILSGVFAIAFVLIAFLTLPALHDRIMSIFTLRGNSSNSFRMNVYLSSIQMFLDNWVIGIGPGNVTFRLVYGLYMVTGFDALGAYSVPLEIAVETGIIGLIIFSWFLLVLFSNSLKTLNKSNSMEIKIIIATCLLALMGMAGQGMFDTIWYRPQVHIIFWMLVAILSNIISNKVEIDTHEL